MKKHTMSALAAAAALAAVAALPAATANADSRTWSCSESGHNLTNVIHYTQDSTYHTWGYLTYKLTGSGTGGKSNWSAKLNAGGIEYNFYADQQNDLDQNVTYTDNFANFKTKRSSTEKWSATAVFDTRAGDNRCTGSTTF